MFSFCKQPISVEFVLQPGQREQRFSYAIFLLFFVEKEREREGGEKNAVGFGTALFEWLPFSQVELIGCFFFFFFLFLSETGQRFGPIKL